MVAVILCGVLVIAAAVVIVAVVVVYMCECVCERERSRKDERDATEMRVSVINRRDEGTAVFWNDLSILRMRKHLILHTHYTCIKSGPTIKSDSQIMAAHMPGI